MLSGSSITPSPLALCAAAAIAGFVPGWLCKDRRAAARVACAGGMPSKKASPIHSDRARGGSPGPGSCRARPGIWSALFLFLVALLRGLAGRTRARRIRRVGPLCIRRGLVRRGGRRRRAALPALRRGGALRLMTGRGARTRRLRRAGRLRAPFFRSLARLTGSAARRRLGAGMLRRPPGLLRASGRRLWRGVLARARRRGLRGYGRRRARRMLLRQVGGRRGRALALGRVGRASGWLSGPMLACGHIRLALARLGLGELGFGCLGLAHLGLAHLGLARLGFARLSRRLCRLRGCRRLVLLGRARARMARSRLLLARLRR